MNFKILIFLLFPILVFSQKKKDEPLTFKDDIDFNWNNSGDTLSLAIENKLLTSIQIYFYSKKDGDELNSFLIPPKETTTILNYDGENKNDFPKKFSDSVRVAYYWGHPSVIEPDLEYPYRFPFKRGKKYEVSQSFNGKASHNTITSKYAIDFQLNVGEPVYAAREGLVIKTVDWFTKQGGEELVNAANKIVILHEDGTMASYVHLDYKGVLVQEGQYVEKGQKIGISGLTGKTSGPHLHFVVRKENDIAIPVYFKGYEGKVLKRGRRYKVQD